MNRTTFSVLAFAAISATSSLRAAPSGSGPLAPSAIFVQAGDGNHTRTLTAGLDWDLPWHKSLATGELSAYAEASLGRWWMSDHQVDRSAWVTQIGLTPVLRYRFGEGEPRPHWFTELGIGLNVLTPVLQDNSRRFSTKFNFGDHLALGRSFGAADENEIALRVQHFSNGGIRQPNPGINFVQLRYVHRF